MGELLEAVVIDTVNESSLVFDKEARLFRLVDVLSLLPGLIVIGEVVNSRISKLDYFGFVGDGEDSDVSDDSSASHDGCDHKVENMKNQSLEAFGLTYHQLAHFSIKEY